MILNTPTRIRKRDKRYMLSTQIAVDKDEYDTLIRVINTFPHLQTNGKKYSEPDMLREIVMRLIQKQQKHHI